MILTKNEFIDVINQLQTTMEFTDKINGVLRCYPDCGYIFPPDGVTAAVTVLEKMFDEPYDIEYFCFELDFGRKWKHGMCTDRDGNDVCLATAADLYDAITNGGQNAR